ncbi:lantibiotic dehydratase [Sphaerisporangium sp. NPDC051017]|uniref:lantibiotic dehydratase n=1 Tax=Sphaerisporangium sp. NPDC051017 TaxID=3154636 RepID=UPI00344291D6
MHQPGFRALDGVIIRASTVPDGLVLPPWPDLDSDDVSVLADWVREVWPLPSVAEAVNVSSPALAEALTALSANPGAFQLVRARSAAASLMRYLLRWTSRATPFGLFAGVALVEQADSASVWFGHRHTVVRRAASSWLAEAISALEAQPDLLRQLSVMANNVGFARGGDWVLPCQPTSDTTVSEVSVRNTAAVRMVMQEARTPIVLADLMAKLAAEAPQTPVTVIEEMLTELVRRRILLTSVRPSVTVTDPRSYIAYIAAQREGLDAAVPALPPGHTETGVLLDCKVGLPPTVIAEVEKTAALLARIAPPRPVWAAYHAAFTDRYGPGAVVAVRDLVDPDRGLGYPAGYRGSIFTDHRPTTSRDLTLAALAQQAALDGRTELLLDEELLADLETTPAAGYFPHTELRVTIAAPTPAAVDRGDFILTVKCASRHAGTSVGRFLHLLDERHQERIGEAYRALPTATVGALAVQLATPILWARGDGLTRVPEILPILSVGEHRHPRDTAVDVDDLAVTADIHRLTLMSLSRGRAVEPLMLNAVDLRRGVHPLARFLLEVSTGTSAPCTPFYWGSVAETFAFLPRVRHGRSVLASARWTLTAKALPATASAHEAWAEAFDGYRRARRVPDRVRFGDDDVLISLDLTDRSHLQLLRRHLDRTGAATVAEDLADDGWIAGRPHEIVVPLASTAPPTPLARTFRPERLHHGPGHLPGFSSWLHAKLYGHPGRQNDLLNQLHDLLDGWWHGPGDWWFIRYNDPVPHLRVRIPLHHTDRYGPAARAVGQWAHTAQKAGLVRDVVLDTYRPEVGRFGTGEALAAAEAVFAADSAVAVAQLNTTMHPQAATAVGILSLAEGFLGDQGPAWLVEHLTHGGGPPLDRQTVKETQYPVELSPGLLERRQETLAAYRLFCDPSDVDAHMIDLVHLHHVRMIGLDGASEKTCLRLARAAAQTRLARATRSV